jgi:alkylated DNA repair dioxygenase AlkB
MDLFPEITDPDKNWLPYDGTAHYWGSVFEENIAQQYFQSLLDDIDWKNDEAIIFGKHIITKRKVAWYADEPFEYTYSKIHRKALLWTPLLMELKLAVEKHTGQVYNSCLLNLYHTGEEGMSWHSDDEKDLKDNGSIASLTFGVRRKFVLKHKTTKHKQDFELNTGDLMEMKHETQQYWVHSVPTTKRVSTPRINLTFRQMIK